MLVDQYWGAVEALDRQRCMLLGGDLIREGRAADLVRLVGDAQRRVGEEWAAARWSVAQEHAATAINDAVLGMVEALTEPQEIIGAVAVLCVEDEWHSMPARLLALALRQQAWDVLFFGASLPSDHIHDFATDGVLTGLAVSCTMPTNLFRVHELSSRLAGRGVPLLGGGRGFGPGGKWAQAAGVDAYAATPEEATQILRGWKAQPATCRGPLNELPAPLLAPDSDELVRAAMEHLTDRFPRMGSYDDRQRRHTQADFVHILEYLDAAALTSDDDLFLTFAFWLQGVLTSRGVPASVLPLSLDCLAEVLGAHADARRRALEAAAQLAAA